MASAPVPKKFNLKGFSDVLDGRLIQFECELPAGLSVCSLCSVVPFEHYTLSCKHVYCGPCFLESVKKSSTTLRCPVDGKLLRPRKAVPLVTTNWDMLRELVAYCCNKDYGCSYIGTLEDMQAHIRDCYEVSCSLCSRKLLRSLLVGHVEAAHSATAKSPSRKPKRHEQAAVRSTEVLSGALVETGETETEKHEGAVTSKETAATQAATTVTQLSHERVLELTEATASRTASLVAEYASKASGSMFRDILDALNLISDRLTEVTHADSVEDVSAAPVVEHPQKQERPETREAHVDGMPML